MAVDILRMEGNQYAPGFGVLQAGPGYGAYNAAYCDPYALQSSQLQLHRGPPLHTRQPHGYFAHHGRPSYNSSNFAFKAHNPVQGVPKRKAADQPPLSQLRQDNLKKTRRHFQGFPETASTPGSTPRTAPRAPDNRHGYLLSAPGSVLHAASANSAQGALHAVTPSAVPGGEEQLWKNSYGNADKEAVQLAAAAGLDFLGSFYDSACGGDDDDTDERGEAEAIPQEAEQPPHTYDEEASYPPQARRKLASQAAYIAQLEEQQLTLRERIFLLEQQLSDARRQLQGGSPGHSGDADEGSEDDRGTSSSG